MGNLPGNGNMGRKIHWFSRERARTALRIRLPYDSRSSCLYWEEDQSGIGIVAPFTPGEYIYEVTMQWPQDGLQATYGLKVVLEEGEDAR